MERLAQGIAGITAAAALTYGGGVELGNWVNDGFDQGPALTSNVTNEQYTDPDLDSIGPEDLGDEVTDNTETTDDGSEDDYAPLNDGTSESWLGDPSQEDDGSADDEVSEDDSESAPTGEYGEDDDYDPTHGLGSTACGNGWVDLGTGECLTENPADTPDVEDPTATYAPEDPEDSEASDVPADTPTETPGQPG